MIKNSTIRRSSREMRADNFWLAWLALPLLVRGVDSIEENGEGGALCEQFYKHKSAANPFGKE